MTECPNCEKVFSARRCPSCGFDPRRLDEPVSPAPPDPARWLCRTRPEGAPCTIEGCAHPGSRLGEPPSRGQVQTLLRDLAKILGRRRSIPNVGTA